MDTKYRLEKSLQERVKELNCLYGMAKLAEKQRYSIENFLSRLVDFLPRSWQYPADTCVRISFKGNTFKSKKYKSTRWRQTAPIFLKKEQAGEIAVYYLKPKPAADEGPFLKEERKLLDEIAKRIGEIAERSFMEQNLLTTNKRLVEQTKALEEADTALRSILTAVEVEKKQIQKTTSENINKLVMPTLNALMPGLPKDQQRILGIIKRNLEEVAYPTLPSRLQNLTLLELNICNMIKNGLRTKEIAQLRKVSEHTINRQRESIRRKLNITDRSINLAAYLQTLSSRSD